ncbi:MAG: M28 family peptidase [Bacteroidetes Order II. Incertae sedis bacterium]|nr:M28 family peptidase [Bacteroidetes Order II. bacterium]
MRVFLVFLCWMISSVYAQSSDRFFAAVRNEIKGERAFETVAFVEKRWRVVGNAGFNESIYHIEEKLKAAGFVLAADAKPGDRMRYRIEKRPMQKPAWEPISARVTIEGTDQPLLDFATNRNMVAINSASTPPEGTHAEVVYVGSGQSADFEGKDVTGKIVFGDGNLFGLYRNALSRGAIGVLAYGLPHYTQPEKNIHSIQFGSIPMSTSGDQQWGILLSYHARNRLLDAINRGNGKLHVQIEAKSYHSEELTIIAEVLGQNKPDERFVFSAHVQEPGANDNASGVGTLLEMARVTAQLVRKGTYKPHRTLTFLWGDEIVSTRRYIREDTLRARGIRWGMSLDMVGEDTAKTGGSFLIEKMPDPSAVWTRGEDKHSEWGGSPMKVSDIVPHYFNDLVIDLCKQQGKYANWTVNTNPFEGGSDHTPFLEAKKPGLLLWHFTDQFYHTDGDRLEMVSPKTMQNVGTCALVTAMTLTTATDQTIRTTAQVLVNAAKIRLETEFALSRAAIQNGKKGEDEQLIIETWRDYYINSIAKLTDMRSVPPSSATRQHIKMAQETIRRFAAKKIAQL